jgi:hypothetical protein
MNEIKFSHNYPKLHGQKSARLLDILLMDRMQLSNSFVDYDTTYNGGKFPLLDNDYMVLIFIGNELIPFTTVRKFEAQKYAYYHNQLNEWFSVVVKSTEQPTLPAKSKHKVMDLTNTNVFRNGSILG